jgi:hypothetical protein
MAKVLTLDGMKLGMSEYRDMVCTFRKDRYAYKGKYCVCRFPGGKALTAWGLKGCNWMVNQSRHDAKYVSATTFAKLVNKAMPKKRSKKRSKKR